ncbi:tetratricopeptide repeat protein [Phenylobacterium sp.]|uniref:tetratricopeptide repeat protein n=1 Tax=Phenylobacterium sp. TaxID=1871053 RepID=UPI0025DC04ED|nr:tetratricopeptide repeat protein [Phenylobacterium sp.]
MPLGLLGLSLLLAVLLAVHVVRTGREMYWLWIILMFQPVGGIVYLIVHVLPDVFGGTTARRIKTAARETLDPHREYREAKAACDDTPTVRNQSRLAQAAIAMGRYDEAERLYFDAAHGIHAEDPALLLGRANALLELNRPKDALEVLETLGRDAANGRTPPVAVALGRANEALGRIAEADTAYQWAAERMPGFEGLARYAAFMARHGRRPEAQEALEEIDKRLLKLRGPFAKEGRRWRDLAAKALAEG